MVLENLDRDALRSIVAELLAQPAFAAELLKMASQTAEKPGEKEELANLLSPPKVSQKTASVKKPRKLPNVLAVHEQQHLIEFAQAQLARVKRRTCQSRINAAARDLFLVRFILGTGLRREEMCNLKLEDVDLVAQHVHVWHGKGDKERFVPLPDKLVPIVRQWVGSRRSGYLVTDDKGRRLATVTLYWRITRLGQYAGFTRKIKPHTLRHTFATRIYEQTGDIRLVQALLGHDDISSSQIYAHVAPSRLLEVVNKLDFEVQPLETATTST